MTQVAEKTVVLTGDVKSENLAMGDFHLHNYADNSRLTEVVFNESDQEYLPPNYMDKLIQKTIEKKIVLIAGDNIFGKDDLSRCLALQLTRKDSFKDRTILELLTESENPDERTSLFDTLNKKRCNRSIVLIHNLHPEKIDYNFDQLIKYAQQESCVFIISVSYGLEIWKKVGQLVSDYWFEIPKGRHYSEVQLQEVLLHRLRKEAPAFWNITSEKTNKNSLLSQTSSIETTLNCFETIDQVNLFFSYYMGLSEFPDDRKLQELVDNLCQGPTKMVRSWFYQLDHRSRIVALAAAMFDGILVDQFFESLNDITNQTFWETSDPSLKALDYFQLTFLDPFFLIQMRDQNQYVFCKTPVIKSVILDLGRSEYRRHFKVALEIFYNLMKYSYSTKSINWELYGTPSKRVLLRKSFGEILHDSGVIEFGLVENHLLELAASGNYFLQNICAKAIAKWRMYGNEEQFFSILKNWQQDNNIQNRIEELFKRSTKDTSTDDLDAIDLIKTTAVLALGHASYYDQPNKLHEDIVHAMVNFAKQSDTIQSNNKFGISVRQALPKFIHHHSSQLRHHLFQELMPLESLRDPIIKGLLLAMENYPEQVSEALEHWFDWCSADASKENRRSMTTQRDNILIVILKVLEQADLSENKYFVNERLYTHYLIPLIKQEKRGEVIENVLSLLVKIQACDFELASRFSAETIGLLTKAQRLFVVVEWGKVYKQQRLETTKQTYERGGTDYAIWFDSQPRPLTSMESVLYRWMEGDSVVRRFATLTFLEFSKSYDRFEQIKFAEFKQLNESQRNMQQVPRPAMIRPVPVLSSEVGLHFWLRIKIFFYFIFSSNTNKFLLKDTILLFLNVNRHYTKDDLIYLINRWKNSSQQGVTSKLAKWLTRFF
ncbi:hypothetical protein [Fluviicola sp.]|uniref:hypothetical protein n=1 Tax=Fluviicola sp. TaxID=1917219 RepID=UPI003D27C7C5